MWNSQDFITGRGLPSGDPELEGLRSMMNSPNDVRLLLDENVSPNIAPRLWDIGVDALPIRDRARLRAPDYRVLQLAITEGRVIATIDEADFEKLVSKKVEHPGVAVMPSGGSRDEQYEFLAAIVNFLRQAPSPMETIRNHIVSVGEDLSVAARLVHAQPRVISPMPPARAQGQAKNTDS
jgi:predicted nuclease of predicted toxin-antitoxin system